MDRKANFKSCKWNMQTIEVTMKQLQQMLKDDKISIEQFSSIIIDNLGEKCFMDAVQYSLEQKYDKYFLTKKIPESLEKIFGVNSGLAKTD